MNYIWFLANVIVTGGAIENTYKLFSAVGGNKDLFSKVSSIISGFGLGLMGVHALDRVRKCVEEIAKDYKEEKAKEEEEDVDTMDDPDEEETYIYVNGEKYVKKGDKYERDGSDQAREVKS